MFFSVVIAVRNEKRYIDKCLKGVFSQNTDEEFEVIVVDGMSTDGTYEILKQLNNDYPFILLQNDKKNAAAGRNLGIKHSNGKYIAFVDGDAIPSPDWLHQIKTIFSRYDKKVAGVGGPDLLPPDSSDKETCIGLVMTSPLARGGKLNPSTQHSLSDKEESVGHIPTCNLCIRKQVLDEMNGFDEEFVKGQDLELNHRIKKAGYQLLYSPLVKVVHYRKNHIRDFTKQIFKWAKAKVAIIKKHGFEGLLSHIYLWPIYATIILFAGLGIFWAGGMLKIFNLIVFLGSISYFGIIIGESFHLAVMYQKKQIFWYSFFLIPLVHLSYSFGVFSSIIKKRIW